MIKNLQKNIEEGAAIMAATHHNTDLTVAQIDELAKDYLATMTPDNLLRLIENTYKVGIAVGARHGRREAKKQTTKSK